MSLGPWPLVQVFLITLLASFLEIAGVSLVYGFAEFVFDPDAVLALDSVSFLRGYFTDENRSLTLVTMGGAIVGIFFFKSLIGFAAIALRIRFAGRLAAAFAGDLLQLYTEQPYERLLKRHSGDVVKNTLTECEILGVNILTPVISLITEAIFISIMVAFLLIMEPVTAIVGILFFAVGYLVIYQLIKTMISKAGEQRPIFARERANAAIEFFGGVRDIIISGHSSHFVKRFTDANNAYVSNVNRLRALPSAPTFGIQFLAVGCAILLLIVFHFQEVSTAGAISAIALFGVASLRMMPAFNSIVREFLAIRGHWKSYLSLMDERCDLLRHKRDIGVDGQSIGFTHSITLRDVTYTYPGSKVPVLCNLNLEIPRGSSIGIVGPTGSGKSTALEIILGLLRPQEGAIELDGRPLKDSEISAWQGIIGYVPQQIFLADDSVINNIAFGVDSQLIDREAAVRAAKLAQIHNFVAGELEESYETLVGERGLRLSGGQIQRLGIARALYRNPQVLILDEATSALDVENERLVSQAIDSLLGSVTTIIVAHRLSTVANCQQVYKLDAIAPSLHDTEEP